MLNKQVDSLVKVLLPNAVKAGGYWQVHSVQGEKGDNLKIGGDGRWADFKRDKSEWTGTGDMLKLVRLTIAPPLPNEKPYANAIRWAKGWLGIESMNPKALERLRARTEAAQRRLELERAEEVDKARLKARNLWLSAAPIVGTPAIRYLEGRGIDFALLGRIPGALRYRHDVWQADYGRSVPALLTAGIGPDGQHWATHATYLHRQGNGDWTKLPDFEQVDPDTGEVSRIKCAKKIFGKGWLGAHFPIHRGQSGKRLREMPRGEAVVVSEGLEDALTGAMVDPARRVVMAGTLGNVGTLVLPPQAGDFVLLAQRDSDPVPIQRTEAAIAAQQFAATRRGAGRRVRMLWPAEGFKDFNDELRGIRA